MLPRGPRPRPRPDANIPFRPNPQLSEKAVLGPAVQPLPWQREDRDVAAGTLCDVAGWGVVSHTGRRPDRLQHLLLPVLDRATCNLRKYHDGTITNSMMCAESSRRDSCKVQGRGWASRGVGAAASGGRGRGGGPACWGRSQQNGQGAREYGRRG